MPLTLSEDEVARVAATSQVLLSPLEHSSIEEWGRASMESLQKLLSADQYLFGWPLPGGQILPVVEDASGAAAVRDYLGYYHQVDVVLVARRLAAGVEVYSARGLVPAPGELERTELYQNWCLPHHLGDAVGMSVSVPEHPTFPALAHVYRERERGPEFGERGQALLKLLLPAFKAGVQTARQLHERRADLERLLDLVGDGILLFDSSGRLLHRNETAGRILAVEPGPDRARLEHEARLAALGVAALLRGPRGSEGLRADPPHRRVRGTRC
jgi:PAS domain-containing protein